MYCKFLIQFHNLVVIKDITVVGVLSRLSIGRRMKKLEVFKEDLERSILKVATFWSLRLNSRISPGGVVFRSLFLREECSKNDIERETEKNKKMQKIN